MSDPPNGRISSSTVGEAPAGRAHRSALPGSALRLSLGRLSHSVLRVTIETMWRGEFTSDEANRLHADAFGANAASRGPGLATSA